MKGRKQSVVARELGVSDATLSRWLKGQRIPVAEYLLLIETMFGVKAGLWGQPLSVPANDSDPAKKAG
jgi:transcriptional regulator with XRE-family HTH domain